VLLASRDGRDGSILVHQDVALWVTRLQAGEKRELPLAAGRHAWVHVARGSVVIGGTAIAEGGGAAVSGEEQLVLEGQSAAEVLVFDLA
jgi:redox-sensitive bicupin YhaK (pirin superfamily)